MRNQIRFSILLIFLVNACIFTNKSMSSTEPVQATDIDHVEATPITEPSQVTPTIDHTQASSTSEDITLVEEGWTDNLTLPCTPSGECLTILPGYYYRIYENTQYPCGAQGYHQFMVLDDDVNTNEPKNLFVKFPGGAVGFWYLDENSQRVYYPNGEASGLLRADYFRNMFFRTSVTVEHSNGVTKKFRENQSFRIMVVSYCSHDLYLGSGEYNEVDGFSRWGYSAAMSAVDYVQQQFNTLKLITYGGSAGASGSFYIGKDQDNVAAIIMDSQAVDLSAISTSCDAGINVFGNTYPCYCPEGGPTCMEVLAPRIGFTFFTDEPYKYVENGLNKPIYLVWNENDATHNAHYQYDNLQNAIIQYNPGGNSIANKVCINDPNTSGVCNLHVPSGYDLPTTKQLVEGIYNWALSRINGQGSLKLYMPVVMN